MEKSKLIKPAIAVATVGAAIVAPQIMPYIMLPLSGLIGQVFSQKDLTEPDSLGKITLNAVGNVLTGIGTSAIWESRNSSQIEQNHHLSRLLGKAYSNSIESLVSEVKENSEYKDQKTFAGLILPDIKKRIDVALESRSINELDKLFPSPEYLEKQKNTPVEPEKPSLWLRMFGYSPKASESLEPNFGRKTELEDFVTKISEDSSAAKENILDEVETSLRRWFREANHEYDRDFPASFLKFTAEKLAEKIPLEIGQLVNTKGFEQSWISFQRAYLQTIHKRLDEAGGLSKEDKSLLQPLTEQLNELAKMPELLAAQTAEILRHSDESEERVKSLISRKAVEYLTALAGTEKRLSEQMTGMEERLSEKIQDNKEKTLPDNIPPPIENFIGRDAYLISLRSEYKNGARCFVLHGIGGVGKSELAKRFLSEIAGEYAAKVYVEMQGMSDNPHSKETAMSEIIRQFAPETDVSVPYEQLHGIFLQKVQQQPTLIFLDNAANKQTVEDLKQARACLVVTSRETFTLTDKQGGIHINLMSPEDARNLLFEFAGAESFADGQADKLAKLAGYLPMALRPLAAILAEDDLETAGTLINNYADLQKLLEAKVPDYYDRTIAASFELSYRKLSEEMQTRWRRLSVFPADFEESAISSVLEISAEEAKETQRQLRRFSLLEVNPETKRFSLHDLTRAFADTKVSDDERFQIQFLHARYYASILLTAQNMQSEMQKNHYSKALKLIDNEWTNITTGQNWTAAHFEKDDDIAKLCTDCSDYARDFIILRLHPRQNISWLESGLNAARKIKDRQSEGNSLGNLGNVYYSLGDYRKAIEYHEQALPISREIGDRQGEGSSLGNLGLTYRNLGDYQKAIDYQEQSLAIKKEIGDRQGEGSSLGNLGNVYYSLGEKEKACGLWKEALAIFEAIESPYAEIARRLIEKNCV